MHNIFVFILQESNSLHLSKLYSLNILNPNAYEMNN